MGVLMQAFYWDCPKQAGCEFDWWSHVEAEVGKLAAVGFTALWLPPCTKAAQQKSMGYNPYDFFDFGKYDQRGGVKTWFGSEEALRSLIGKAHKAGVQVYADIVPNHCDGGDMEHNPDFNVDRKTGFGGVLSKRFTRGWKDFHPCRFERWDNNSFGDMPDLCHRSPYVYENLLAYAETLVADLGFDGFRFDFVRGYGAWLAKSIQERQYVRRGSVISPFGVGEAWSSSREIGDWLDEANRWSDNPMSAMDFPCRYRLKDLCDKFGYSVRSLVDPGALFIDRPFQAVTFVENHDFRGGDSPPVINDKMLGYAFILTMPGYPTVFWQDYFEFGLAQPGWKSGIAALVEVHEKYAGGDLVVRYADDDLLIAERIGWGSQPGLILALNNRGDGWNGRWVDTSRACTRYVPMAWRGGADTNVPLESWTQADKRGQFWAPPRGYAVYVPQ